MIIRGPAITTADREASDRIVYAAAQEAMARQLAGGVVNGCGDPGSAVAVVGERPGKVEALQGRPFAGPAGHILDVCWEHADMPLSRAQCWITNLVNDYQDRDPEDWEICRDSDRLARELSHCRYIIAVGAYSMRALLGSWAQMDLCHGVAYYDACGHIVVPVLHPASALYNPDDMGTVWWDLTQAAEVMSGARLPVRDSHRHSYRYDTGRVSPMLTANQPLALDTEFSATGPWGWSYSQTPGYAKVEQVKTGDTDILASRLREADKRTAWPTVLMHNSPADFPALDRIAPGLAEFIQDRTWDDTMYKAYNLPGIHPLSLKSLAHRLCGMDMLEYSEVLGPADRGLALCYLEAIPEHLRILPPPGRGHTLGQRVAKIVKDSAADAACNPRKRWMEVCDERPLWRKAVAEALGPMPEATLDDVPETVAIRYSGRDADGTVRINGELDALLDQWQTRGSYELDKSVLPAMTRMIQVGTRINVQKLETLALDMTRRMIDIAQRLGINPDSGDQVADLLFNRLGHKAKKLTESGKRGKADDRLLESLRHVCPEAGDIADYREYSKIKGNFCVNLIGAVDESSRLHPDMAMRARSGRFTCKAPNMLGLPVLSDTGILIRDAVEAEDGHTLGEWDYSQVEIRWLAHLSRDPKLCRAYLNREDIHANTAAEMFGIRLQDVDELKHRFPAKRVTCATYGGITEDGVLAQMDKSGANSARARAGLPVLTLDDTRRMITEWFKIYPGAADYMDLCRAEARRYGYVRDSWGRVTLLPGVWSDIRRVRASAERQAPSYHIQGGATGHFKKGIAALWPWYRRWRSEGWYAEMLLPVHDAVLGEFDDRPERRAVIDAVMTGEMQNAAQLIIPVVAKGHFGRTWKETKK